MTNPMLKEHKPFGLRKWTGTFQFAPLLLKILHVAVSIIPKINMINLAKALIGIV
jgi:hypothetical protein